MKYKVQVIADDSDTWVGNGLEFDSVQTAANYAEDLERRWTLVQDWRVLDENNNVVLRKGFKND